MGLNLCSSLGNLAIATGIVGMSSATVIGIHNKIMHHGNFLPDAALIGGSLTFSLKSIMNFSQKITDKVSSYIDYFRAIGLPTISFITKLQNQLAGITLPPQILNVASTTGNLLYNQLSIVVGVDYVGSNSVKDSRNAFFFYVSLALTSAKTDNFPNGSLYTGFIWNMPSLDNYRGSTIGLGGEYGVGYISIGMNYFVSLTPNENGLYTRGYTFGWNFGSPSKELELSGTYTHAWGPLWEH
jgi:hypothetical protein